MLQKILRSWKHYRYRFVPWLAFNLSDRSTRYVDSASTDKILEDKVITETLIKLFTAFHDNLNTTDLFDYPSASYFYNINNDSVYKILGFKTRKIKSEIPEGGEGVGVIEGKVPKGCVVSLYPGAVYQPTDPIFYQSIGNSYIFRCVDGLLIDGCSSGLSKLTYKGCDSLLHGGKDSVRMCDQTWMTDNPANPLAVGQYVNNHTKDFPANVAYQEYDLPADFPLHLRRYIPNVHYIKMSDGSVDIMQVPDDRTIRMVVLVSLRDIYEGEELFSSYFTLVQDGKNET